MNNKIVSILKLYNSDIDFIYLNKLISSLELSRDHNIVLYDLINGRFIYSKSLQKIENNGFPEEYLNNGYRFLKTFCHPFDLGFLLNEILSILYYAKYEDKKIIKSENSGIFLRMKDSNGEWHSRKVHLIYLNGCTKSVFQILLGFIEDLLNQDKSLVRITLREKEIFNYLSSGYSSKMIANELNISETTVITHRRNLIHKLHVKNSAELISKGFELNLNS